MRPWLITPPAWHLPLYRQAQMLAAQGLDITRAVLAFWVGYAAAELKPVYVRLRELAGSSTPPISAPLYSLWNLAIISTIG